MKGVVLPLALTLAVQSLTSMAMIAPLVMAPVVALELGVPPHGVGWFVMVEYSFAMISGLACGGLIWRYGPVRVCQIAICLAAVGLALGSTGTLPLVFAAAALIGAGYGVVNPASSYLLARASPPGMMSLIFSIKQTGVPVGGMLAGAVVPPLILYFSWRWSAAVVALLCVSLALATWRTRSTAEKLGRTGASASFLEPLGMVFANPPVLELAVVSLIFSSTQITLFTYFVSYLHLELGYSLVAAGLVYSSAHAAGIFGRVAWGAVADRWLSPRRTLGLLGVMMTLSGAGVACFSADWPLAAVIAVSVLFGASAVGWNGVYLAQVARLAPPGQVGAITGGTQVFTFVGALATPPIFGLVVGLAGGYGNAYFLLCLLPGLAGVYQLARERRR